ncbi:hypothetical protein RFI_30943, partial [Reticulomyxa filosa]
VMICFHFDLPKQILKRLSGIVYFCSLDSTKFDVHIKIVCEKKQKIGMRQIKKKMDEKMMNMYRFKKKISLAMLIYVNKDFRNKNNDTLLPADGNSQLIPWLRPPPQKKKNQKKNDITNYKCLKDKPSSSSSSDYDFKNTFSNKVKPNKLFYFFFSVICVFNDLKKERFVIYPKLTILRHIPLLLFAHVQLVLLKATCQATKTSAKPAVHGFPTLKLISMSLKFPQFSKKRVKQIFLQE